MLGDLISFWRCSYQLWLNQADDACVTCIGRDVLGWYFQYGGL